MSDDEALQPYLDVIREGIREAATESDTPLALAAPEIAQWDQFTAAHQLT